MSPSFVPAAEDALIDRLQARTALSGFYVGFLPSEPLQERERVFVLAVQDVARTPLIQQGPREESFVVPLQVELHIVNRDGRADARDQMWAVIDEIEQGVAADDSNDLLEDAEVDRIVSATVLPMGSGEGWLAQALVHVRVQGMI